MVRAQRMDPPANRTLVSPSLQGLSTGSADTHMTTVQDYHLKDMIVVRICLGLMNPYFFVGAKTNYTIVRSSWFSRYSCCSRWSWS